jgi:microsomal dipeptidase-like Zn-dependent dipeptidase
VAPLSRRQFVKSALFSSASFLATGALTSVLGCRSACDSITPLPPKVGRRVLADLHAHPMLNKWVEGSPIAVQNPLLAKIAKSLLNPTDLSWKTSYEAGVDVICVAHFDLFDEWLSMPTDPDPEAPAHTIRMMNFLEEELQREPTTRYAVLARNAQQLREMTDIRRDDRRFRTAVVHALEGGHALGGNPSAVEEFAKRGVAMIGVTHFFHKGIGSAANAFPFFPDSNSRWPNLGLSEFGRFVVRRMEELGLIVDVSHATSATLQDILCEVSGPVVATHVSARALGDHPYSLYDEHIQEIGRRGGIIGIILMPYWLSNFSTEQEALSSGSLSDVVRTIVYVAKLVGTEHIGIGSDFAGYIPGPRDMKCLGEIHKLRGLLDEEFGEEVTDKIMAQNAIDFLIKNWTYTAG